MVPRSVQRKPPSLKWDGVGQDTQTHDGGVRGTGFFCEVWQLPYLTISLFPGTSQTQGIPSLPKGKRKQPMRLGWGGGFKTGTGGRESSPLPRALFFAPSESFHW